MRKHIIPSAAFVLALMVILQALAPIFIPKDNTKKAGYRFETGIGYLAEPENTIDVVFLGDSRAYHSVIPLEMWEKYGFTTCLCGSPTEYITQTYTTLEQVMERQKPKVVILETDVIYEQPMFLMKLVSFLLERYFPFVRYHDRWKQLQWEDFTSGVNYRTVQRDKGYVHETRIKPVDTNDNMAPGDQVILPVDMNIAFVRRIWELCNENGAELVLYTAPTTWNWYTAYHNGTKQIARELGIDYIDANVMPEEIPIDWQLDTCDAGDHMNYTGASKVTDFFGMWLWDTGLLSDKREDPAYGSWNDCLDGFQADLARDYPDKNQ